MASRAVLTASSEPLSVNETLSKEMSASERAQMSLNMLRASGPSASCRGSGAWMYQAAA